LTTTTKIFIVLVCLFAFIFTPVAIVFASRTYNWKSLAENYQHNAQTAEAAARSAKAIGASEVEYYRSLRDQDQQRALSAQQKSTELEQKLAGVTAQRDELDRKQDMLQTQNTVLADELKVQSTHNKELTDTREKALAHQRELQGTNAWLTDRVQKLQAESDVLKQQLNQRLQEIAAFREENDQLRRSMNLGKAGEVVTATSGPSAEPMTPSASSPVQGSVTEIRGGLATVDVGSASGIQPGMTMVVTRDNFREYVGDLKITKDITPNQAVGQVVTAGGKQVRPGDTVLDERSFNAR
jgi:hypothetical protein